jgi:hypothetical protein
MSSRLYYLGLLIDALLLLLACGSAMMMHSTLVSSDGVAIDASDGLTAFGRIAAYGIPLLLFALMGVAHALKTRGSIVAANVLLWLPALPFGLALIFWGGLAVIFALFSRQ